MSDSRGSNPAKAGADERAKCQASDVSARREEAAVAGRPRNRKTRSPKVRKRKRRFEPTEKLPTPPPDPRAGASREEEGAEQSAKRNKSPPTEHNKARVEVSSSSARGFARAFAGTEEAFQQLDRLRAILEEVLELRQKNAKLFRRVRELERQRASRRLDDCTARFLLAEELPPEDETNFAESLLAAMLESSAASSQAVPGSPSCEEQPRPPGFRPPLNRQRSRSISDGRPAKRSSCYLGKPGKRNSIVGTFVPPKISKWTKVKAAFRWERASMGTSLPLGNVVLEAMEQESAKFLRPPDAPDTTTSTTTLSGSSPRTAEHSGPPSPGTLSSSSSMDDVYNGGYKRTLTERSSRRNSEEDPAQRSRSLESESSNPQNAAGQSARDTASRRSEKSYKTPWGMVKDIIQSRRDNGRRPARSSVRSDDGYSLSSHESSDMIPEITTSEQQKPRQLAASSPDFLVVPGSKPSSQPGEIVDLASRRLTPTLTITLPSSEELRSVSPESPASSVQQQQPHHDSTDDNRSPSEELDSRARVATGPNSPIASISPRQPARLQRQDSKWNKVKRAFLSGASSVPPSPSRMSSFFDETDAGGSYSASAEELDNGGISPTIQADIQRNYQLLHDKLSMEFHRKLSEWDKLKNGQGPSNRAATRCTTSPKDKDSANLLLLGEEQLTPEFKKKLQEWKRIKKGSTPGTTSPEQQVSRRRLTDWQIWRTPAKSEGKADSDSGKIHLTEDFLKKMEEWKKMKSARSDEEQSGASRRDSAEIYQIYNDGQSRKLIDDKEFQPLDKVITMIEREQQRVERHREQLLDNLSRVSDFGHVLDGKPEKREVLVRTSTGFYRFEGISQEFTRKLYEWEKSQGIAPECSTFRLLKPAYDVFANDNKLSHNKGPRSLKRSKSMSSVVENSQREETPMKQPSSLSLNDVSNLESEAKLRIDSKQTIGEEEMSEELALDSEPEAVIVDIEDVIEETASPMAKFQPQQTPVYCVTASETTSIAVPLGTVTASHEPSPVILIQAGENYDPKLKKYCHSSQCANDKFKTESNLEINSNDSHSSLEMDVHKTNDFTSDEHRKRIFEPNDIKICETIIEEEVSSSLKGEASNSDDETSSVKTENDVESLKEIEIPNGASSITPDIQSEVSEESETAVDDSIKSKEDLSQNLENTNTTSADDFSKENCDSLVLENKLDEVDKTVEEPKLTSTSNDNSQNHVDETDSNADDNQVFITVNSNVRQKKVLKTRRLTDTQVGYQWQQPAETIKEISPEPTDSPTVSTYSETPNVQRIIINESTLNKIVVPTASNEQISTIADEPKTYGSSNVANDDETHCRRLNIKTESKNVFVKTKRMIFSPFSRRNSKDKNAMLKDEPEARVSINKETSDQSVPQKCKSPATKTTVQKLPDVQRSKSSSECLVPTPQRPPLPQSPILSRKEYRRLSPKETAPSIRMMIQRYNQKLQEDAGSPASSGSGSPIWRSPISERRVRTQMERYQEEVQRAIAGSPRSRLNGDRSRLEKSASAGVIQSAHTPIAARNARGEILKSTSVDFVRNASLDKQESIRPITGVANQVREDARNEEGNDVSFEKRKNSLKNAEIFTNIKQSLVQEYKTLQIKTDDTEDDRRAAAAFLDRSDKDGRQGHADEARRQPEKFSPDLMHKLNALTSVTSQKNKRFYTSGRTGDSQVTSSENSTPLRIRAQRLKKAKDDFFSRGPSCYSHDPSIESCCYNQNLMAIDANNKMDFVKSASAGMINAESRMFERVSTTNSGNLESLPRVEKACSEITGTFSKLASKFRRTKLKKGKDKEGKMSTVSMLCRQSLFVDIQPDGTSKSCPTSPAPQRDEDELCRFKQSQNN